MTDEPITLELPQPKKTGRPKGSKDGKLAIRERQQRKILELKAKNVPVPAIAAAVGVSESTVRNRLRDLSQVLQSLDKIEDWEKQKGDLLSAAQYKLLNEMMKDEKLDKASVNNLAYAFQQVHTATRLERGQSTSNINTKIQAFVRVSEKLED